MTRVRGIAATRPARTLVDLAATLTPPQLAKAAHEASVIHDVGAPQIEAVLARRPSSPGARTLRRIVHGEVNISLSALESQFLSLLASVDLPVPKSNAPAGGRHVDCRWPDRALTVELDGYRYHASRHAWERDRRREREAFARGDEFRRYTYADVVEDSRAMLRELQALLAT